MKPRPKIKAHSRAASATTTLVALDLARASSHHEPNGSSCCSGTELTLEGALLSKRNIDMWSALLTNMGARADEGAFHQLFDHFAPRLKSYFLRAGASDSEAEDVAQEALLIVWRKAHLFDQNKATAATWIFTIARNRRIDLLRKSNRPEPDPEDPFFQGADAPTADEEISSAQEAARVRAALSELPEAQREAVIQSFFDDKAHGEIAQDLGAPLGTVKSRIRLGLQRLRSALEGELNQTGDQGGDRDGH